MTYEEYLKAVYDECKTYAVVQANPEDFEKVFKEVEKSGVLKDQFEDGVPALSNSLGIVLQV